MRNSVLSLWQVSRMQGWSNLKLESQASPGFCYDWEPAAVNSVGGEVLDSLVVVRSAFFKACSKFVCAIKVVVIVMETKLSENEPSNKTLLWSCG